VEVKRIVISLLLLCTYSLSFAQGLLPHSHDWQDGIGNEEHHHYGYQDKDSSNKGEGKQGDDSLLDLILCFLTDLDNPDDDAKIETNNPNLNSQKVFQKAQLAAVILSFIPLPEPELQYYVPRVEPLFRRLLTRYIPQRGPPTIS